MAELDGSDEAYVARTFFLARAAASELDEVPVGAVLVLGDLVIEARNEKESRPDPTAHAEILVLREAARQLGVWRLSGATIYISKEPCIMCAGALIAARVARVVFGAFDPKGGAAGSVLSLFDGPGTNHYVEVRGGVLEEEASALLQQFFRHRRNAQRIRNLP